MTQAHPSSVLTAVIALAASVAFSGCAIVGSRATTQTAEGIAYMLPKALLPVTLADKGGALELSVGDPVLMGDPAHTYVLQRTGNVFTSDNVNITVDPKTGLLTAADVKSDDKTLPAIIELLKGKASAEAADASTETTVVFRGLLDPGAEASQLAAFNVEINAAAQRHIDRLQSEGGCAQATPPVAPACKTAQQLRARVASQPFQVQLGADAKPEARAADCNAGICYRVNVPHVVTLSGAGVVNSAVLALPNRSPTFVLPLERWAFVRTTHDVKLEGGTFKSLTTDRPSSALAVAAAPVQAASAVLGTVTQVVQLKLDLSGKEKALSDAKVAEINARSKLDELLIEKGGKAEAAFYDGQVRSTKSLLSISVGDAAPRDAAAVSAVGKNPVEQPAAPTPASVTPGKKTSTGSAGK